MLLLDFSVHRIPKRNASTHNYCLDARCQHRVGRRIDSNTKRPMALRLDLPEGDRSSPLGLRLSDRGRYAGKMINYALTLQLPLADRQLRVGATSNQRMQGTLLTAPARVFVETKVLG
jgi:hypothetical protein